MNTQGTTMNYLQQFETMLNGLDDSESKTGLVDAFKNVKVDFNGAITARDDAKTNLRDSQSLTVEIGKALGIDGSFSANDVTSKLSKLSNTEALESLKTELTTSHESEMSKLRTLLETEKTSKGELNTQLNDMLFSNAINKDGLLTGFVDDPKMRSLVEGELKSKLLFEDGQIYVNDGSGGRSKNVSDNSYLTPKTIIDGMKAGDEWKGFLSPQTQGRQGGGMGTQARGNQPQKANMGGTKEERIQAIQENMNK